MRVDIGSDLMLFGLFLITRVDEGKKISSMTTKIILSWKAFEKMSDTNLTTFRGNSVEKLLDLL